MGRFFNTVTAQKHFRPGRLQYCQQTVNGSTKPIHIQLPHHCTKKEVKKVRSDPFPVNSQKLNHNEFGAPIHMSYYTALVTLMKTIILLNVLLEILMI